jgi:SAM-dependent methyltransferase
MGVAIPMVDGYREDLAYIHDAGFGGFALQSAPGLLSMLRRCGITAGLVVDLGCGSGLWARALTDAGYKVLGIDRSAAMLRIARVRVPQARFLRASYLSAKLPPCEAITALGECFNFLFDETNRPAELLRFFGRVHEALGPGGVFAFDVATPGRGRGPCQRHHQGTDWAVLVEKEEDERKSILTRRITTFRRVGRLYRREVEVHSLRLYRTADLESALRQLGFRTRRLRGYGEFRFPHGWAGLLARKP